MNEVLAALALAAPALYGCSACPKPNAPAPKPAASVASAAPTASACPPPAAEDPGDDEVAEDEGAEDEGDVDDSEGGEPAAEPPDPTRDAEWRWAKARFPEVERYQLLDEGLLGKLLAWAKPREKIAVWDRACRSAFVRRTGDKLFGTVHRGVELTAGDPDRMSESYGQIQIGWSFDEFPSNWAEFTRDGHGNWRRSGTGGFGDGRSVARQLSEVTEDAAWFDDAPISLRIVCNRVVEERQRCAAGEPRTCNRCEGWGPVPSSLTSSFGISRHPKKRTVKGTSRVDCSQPCPAIEEPPDVTRANRALEKRDFVYRVDDEHKPVVFRTEAACTEYTKKHPFDADDLLLWEGDKAE